MLNSFAVEELIEKLGQIGCGQTASAASKVVERRVKMVGNICIVLLVCPLAGEIAISFIDKCMHSSQLLKSSSILPFLPG
jgi:hypothetical protein